MNSNSTLVPATRRPGARALASAALVAMAAAACDCSDTGLGAAGPLLVVTPDAISVEGIPNRVSEITLRVTNEGTTTAQLGRDMYFLEDFGEFAVFEQWGRTCDGVARPESARSELAADDCALVVLRYLPKAESERETVLRIESNARNPVLDVPINASARTPVLEVCGFNGGQPEGCYFPGDAFTLDFGTVVPGTGENRTLVLRSTGTRSVEVYGLEMEGDFDYTVEPDGLEKTMEVGDEETLTLTFNPITGGMRVGTLIIHTNVPGSERIEVTLLGQGDGPGICLCVGDPGEACRRANSVADFGQVMLENSTEREVNLTSCGTRELVLNALELANDDNAFTVVNPPTLPVTLAIPGQGSTGEGVQFRVRFAPTTVKRYNGRINIRSNAEESGTPQPFVRLVGDGVDTGCRLVAPATLDFGTVAKDIEARRELVVTNQGEDYCNVLARPEITAGETARFGVAGFPQVPFPVPPGGTAVFSMSFTPQAASGTSNGEVMITYAPDIPGASERELRVNLRGTATAEARCILQAQPGSRNPFTGMWSGSLAFGNVRINHEAKRSVTLQNTGAAYCEIRREDIKGSFVDGVEGNPSRDFSITKRPQRALGPGEQTSIEVTLKPSKDIEYGIEDPFGGLFAGLINLEVITTDTVTFANGCTGFGFPPTGTPGCVNWALTGRGVRADLHVVPRDVDFGLITLGCGSRDQTLTLYNAGLAPIEVSSVSIEPSSATNIFRASTPGTPFVIPPNGSRQVRVRYIPPNTSEHTASLKIVSDATNSTEILVSLRGKGTTDSSQTDVFDKSRQPKSDILFVIDDSGSMGDVQSHLSNNARSFIQVADNLDSDYQIGVTTTDVFDEKKQGRFQGNPKIITPGPNAINQFASNVSGLGTNGHHDERGLQAMVMALTDPAMSAENAGFLRNDSKLVVVMVSDEEDGSQGSVDFYIDFLRNVKGAYNQGMVQFHAIVGNPQSGGCSGPTGTADAGYRYVAVADAFNGKWYSICNMNWAQTANDIGLDAFAEQAAYPLSRVADPGQGFTVKVDGVTRNQGSHWRYDAASNSIVFEPDHIPQPGSTVEIRYTAECFAI